MYFSHFVPVTFSPPKLPHPFTHKTKNPPLPGPLYIIVSVSVVIRDNFFTSTKKKRTCLYPVGYEGCLISLGQDIKGANTHTHTHTCTHLCELIPHTTPIFFLFFLDLNFSLGTTRNNTHKLGTLLGRKKKKKKKNREPREVIIYLITLPLSEF